MSNVFILGAGFSKEVEGHMPLLKDLSVQLRERRGELFPPYVLELGDDVELWMTYLSQPQPWLKEQHNIQNQYLFRELSEQVADIINKATRSALTSSLTPPLWLQQLVDFWHQDRSTVITLNYDTLVERVARSIEFKVNGRPHNLALDHIYPIPIGDVRRRTQSVLGVDPVDTFKLLKLHGSVNWYYSGATNFMGELLYFGQVDGWGESRTSWEADSRLASLDKVPLIVPPAAQKTPYFQHETIRRVWQLASEAIQGAERIFVIGYSLPLTDLGMRFFLHYSAPADEIPMSVVNTNNHAAKDYRARLPKVYRIEEQFVGNDAINRLVNEVVRSG
ncbi:MAG: hypothetical protein HYX93_06490 [Chloroflexi bacterium]|nr:hypothetical protein [Chloroflexota bacterium]